MENTKANQCAFPADARTMTDGGMTMREYYAGQAMAAMIANPNILRPQANDKKEEDIKKFSAIAVEYADGLLSALANEA